MLTVLNYTVAEVKNMGILVNYTVTKLETNGDCGELHDYQGEKRGD